MGQKMKPTQTKENMPKKDFSYNPIADFKPVIPQKPLQEQNKVAPTNVSKPVEQQPKQAATTVVAAQQPIHNTMVSESNVITTDRSKVAAPIQNTEPKKISMIGQGSQHAQKVQEPAAPQNVDFFAQNENRKETFGAIQESEN